MAPAQAELESEVREIGGRLFREAGRHKPALFDSGGLRGRVLKRVLQDPILRNALFQFIDVLPQLEHADDVAVRFRSYLAGQRLGGVTLSGTGIQAGGPDYLKQFMWTRVVSENTMRHGFVP